MFRAYHPSSRHSTARTLKRAANDTRIGHVLFVSQLYRPVMPTACMHAGVLIELDLGEQPAS